MKRIVSAILLIAVFLSAFGCKNSLPNKEGDIKIMATIFPLFDFAQSLTKGINAEVLQLLPANCEVHSFEPTPKDILQIKKCDLFLYIGGESDEWVEDIIKNTDVKAKTVKLIDCVTPLDELEAESHEGEGDGHEHEYDEHIWTSPKNAMLMVDEIKKALIEIDSDNSSVYTENAKNYTNELSVLDRKITDTVNASKNKTLIFADRFPFLYLAYDYDIKFMAAYNGCSTEAEARLNTVSDLIEKVKAEKITTVFYIEFSNEALADTVCGETGAKKAQFHSCHNITSDEKKAGETYISLMEKNVLALKEALG